MYLDPHPIRNRPARTRARARLGAATLLAGISLATTLPGVGARTEATDPLPGRGDARTSIDRQADGHDDGRDDARPAGPQEVDGEPTCDFTGNGVDDLAIGVPGEDGKGSVNIQYHGDGWLDVPAQLRPGVELPDVEPGANLGGALACGDFDGDGIADLAIGAPHQPPGGWVIIRYGVAGEGLTGATRVYRQHQPQISPSSRHAGVQRFGFSLAVGDFDGDGVDDLAVGNPHDTDAAGETRVGSVEILPGRKGHTGLDTTRSYRIRGWDIGKTTPRHSDFGWALAVGRFAGTKADGLAVGAPGAWVWTGRGGCTQCRKPAGMVYVFRPHGELLPQLALTTPHLATTDPYTSDRFGHAMAAGDFDGDGKVDLAVGAPFENGFRGGVHVYRGDHLHLDLAASFGPELASDTSEFMDQFGFALAAGDTDADGLDDLAVGAPSKHVAGSDGAGKVYSFRGHAHELVTGQEAVVLHLDIADMAGEVEEAGLFGASIATLGLHQGGIYSGTDLVIGAPGTWGPPSTWTASGSTVRPSHAGAVHIVPGIAGVPFEPCNPCSGVVGASTQLHQDTGAPHHVANDRQPSASPPPHGIYWYWDYPNEPGSGEWFGWSVAS